jgi:hypothetical protein
MCVCVCVSFLSFIRSLRTLRNAVPYTFGYLFALGVYAHGETAGDGFHAQYVALLRDTGRMTAEELVQVRENALVRTPVACETVPFNLPRQARDRREDTSPPHV